MYVHIFIHIYHTHMYVRDTYIWVYILTYLYITQAHWYNQHRQTEALGLIINFLFRIIAASTRVIQPWYSLSFFTNVYCFSIVWSLYTALKLQNLVPAHSWSHAVGCVRHTPVSRMLRCMMGMHQSSFHDDVEEEEEDWDTGMETKHLALVETLTEHTCTYVSFSSKTLQLLQQPQKKRYYPKQQWKSTGGV